MSVVTDYVIAMCGSCEMDTLSIVSEIQDALREETGRRPHLSPVPQSATTGDKQFTGAVLVFALNYCGPEMMRLALRRVCGWNPDHVQVSYCDELESEKGFQALDGWRT